MSDYSEGLKVDAVVSIDSKGQIVLPKDLREKSKLKSGDKLAIMACEKEGEVCCIVIVKAEGLGEAMSKLISPALRQVIR
ncbi:AbrB/MazE/SpoVT family DNA-binding domain-containing protein [Candidatus Bathyarchaeota archaeon]|nr:AbrB/MazE/SpoVT family DNA-binding domain-containing protein [Candidatus Bathyarchaeota archaeon]